MQEIAMIFFFFSNILKCCYLCTYAKFAVQLKLNVIPSPEKKIQEYEHHLPIKLGNPLPLTTNNMWKQTVFLQWSLLDLNDPVCSSITLHKKEAYTDFFSCYKSVITISSLLAVSCTCQIPQGSHLQHGQHK